jgi:ribosomal protein S18 acetylase RimI-like enzyme
MQLVQRRGATWKITDLRLVAEGQQSPAVTFEPLGSGHDRAAFSSSNLALNDYLRRQAGQDLRKRVAAPFVMTPDGRTIAGYYTLSQYAVDIDGLPEEVAQKLPKYPDVPATLIGRLAVDDRFRGQRLGEKLLMDALRRCLDTSRQVASAVVVVDAKDEDAVSFYKKYGFMELPGVARRLLLPMRTVAEMFNEA